MNKLENNYMKAGLMRFSLIALAALAIFFQSCKNEDNRSQAEASTYKKIEGQTMGTTYHITFSDTSDYNFKVSVDSILVKVNEEVSTYIPTSIISLFNQTG